MASPRNPAERMTRNVRLDFDHADSERGEAIVGALLLEGRENGAAEGAAWNAVDDESVHDAFSIEEWASV